MKNIAKNKLHSPTGLSLVVLASLALALAFSGSSAAGPKVSPSVSKAVATKDAAHSALAPKSNGITKIAPPQGIPVDIPDACASYNLTSGTATFVPGVDDTGNHCDDCTTAITIPFPVMLYDQMYTTAMVGSNGALFFGASNSTFSITCSPLGVGGTTYTMGPYWDDQVTFNSGEGIFTTTTGTAPNRVFYVEWRSEYYNTGQPLNYEVALYENGTPPFQYIYNSIPVKTSANDSQLVVGVKKDDTAGDFTQYGCDSTGGTNPPVGSGQALTAVCVGNIITCPTPPPCTNPYTFTVSTGTITPGTTDVGNHCDDCDTTVTLPFPYNLYDQTFTTVHVGSNGHTTFGMEFSSFGVVCPMPEPTATYAIGPYWTDQCTGPCGAGGTSPGIGIYTTTTGSAPNRVFYIEYRTNYYNTTTVLDYEVALYEGQKAFDVIYALVQNAPAANDSALAVGVQQNSTLFTQQGCDTTGGTAPPVSTGQLYHYTAAACPPPPPAPVPTSAVSEKQHGAGGPLFDINLPLVPLHDPGIGIEDRQQGGSAGILWYNGDFNAVNGLANEVNTAVADAHVYDNFIVPAGAGWDVTSVFSDDLISTTVTGATYEIRSGVSSGNGGTLVASGSGTPTVTPTGRAGFGFTEFQVELAVSPTLHLPPGTYWLNVTVVGNGTGRAFDSQTSGANAIGMPPGNDMNAFLNSTTFGNNFTGTCDPAIAQCADFSMGVKGPGGINPTFSHTMIVTFANPVSVQSVAVTNGTGSVASFTVAGPVVTINLTGVTNAQRLGVTLHNVCDGTNQGDVFVPMGLLAADSSGNGNVNAGDILQIKQRLGQALTTTNFRSDVNANGAINAGDVGVAKQNTGTALPP